MLHHYKLIKMTDGFIYFI
uniref:Uncharacterized protein n=1 Tax=Rhizophora mucronata TaxID=61149 RepID=A0A2P2JWP2_RHIMU